MAVHTAVGVKKTRGDEEAFLWACAALGEARKHGERRASTALEALIEDLAFGLGAHAFPPKKASRPG